MWYLPRSLIFQSKTKKGQQDMTLALHCSGGTVHRKIRELFHSWPELGGSAVGF
jgi:hypothetical protein